VKRHQSGVESLTVEEKFRLRLITMSTVYALDASFFAYQQGLLPEFESTLEVTLKSLAPAWRDLGVDIPRESFKAEVDRILAMVDKEAAATSAETA
jgi:hypothetical protein